MNNAKMKMVTTNVFHRLGIGVAITLAWVIGAEVLVSLAGLIADHNVESFLVTLRGIPGTLTFFITAVLVAYFLVTPYVDFKWAIQNGISRKTMWRGRFAALFLATLAIYIIDELLALTNRPYPGANVLFHHFLALLTITLTFQAIGNGFGLLSRRWKWIVGIGLPIAFIIIMWAMASLLIKLMESNLLLGYQHNHWVGAFSNPVVPWAVWLIYFVVILFLTKVFNDRLQLRRD